MLTHETQEALQGYDELRGHCSATQHKKIIGFLRLYAAAALDIYTARTQLNNEAREGTQRLNYYAPLHLDVQTRSTMARETIIGIDPTMALDLRGLPLTQRDQSSLPAPKRTRLTTYNSEALRQRHQLGKYKRPPATATSMPTASARDGIG
jgi:hypothetical protein